MSKEMLVIALGVLTAVVTQLGIPGSWKLSLLFLTGVAIAGIGFLLRGEALSRTGRGSHLPGQSGTSFVESPMPRHDNEQKDGINSLN
ncbi:MAG: hypothetical protein AAB964_02450 [Patescibacteria group bacterium]